MRWCMRTAQLLSRRHKVQHRLQDRMKEWGKRYLEPFGSAIGIRFPDRIRKLHDYTGKVCTDCASPD